MIHAGQRREFVAKGGLQTLARMAAGPDLAAARAAAASLMALCKVPLNYGFQAMSSGFPTSCRAPFLGWPLTEPTL